MEDLNLWLVGGGFTVGGIFGLLVQHHRFCMISAVGNYILINDNRYLLAFFSAIAIAIAGTQLLEFTDIVAVADSSYRNSQLDWFGASLGGLIFGVGGVIAGGCATQTLIKSAEGKIYSLIVLLFFMLLAASAQFGFLETLRLSLTSATAINLDGDASIAAIFGLPQWLPAVVIVSLLAAYVIKNWNSDAKMMVFGAMVIGSLVVCSWYITGVLAQDEFDPTKPSGITVSGPIARFGYILIAAKFPVLSYAISFVTGAFLTVLIFTFATGRYQFEPVRKGSLKFAILGGSLMGVGSIMAYGCNVGQGLTGISTLSFESLLAVLGMILGSVISVRWMERHS
jgi:uncharacterized membrane protein YedE/YeeE